MEIGRRTISILKNGGVGVAPTDTIYGLVGQALNKKTVARIYRLKKRTPTKPLIILIHALSDLKKFGVPTNQLTNELINQIWPGKVSIILPCAGKKYSYLHRGTRSLAFRMPKPAWLRNLLRKTGPLVAPSANPEGLRPAATITAAKKYFGNKVNFYQNRGRRIGKPSKLLKIMNGNVMILRK